ncbi:AI-2E family transporter [Marinobacter adhaerens]|uniref:AI-2E family transporter n=1 Tax=Marinobacter adhaerens TaxID=1033846 RepID=A0A851HYP1_9GAMM|nr:MULTISPECIES: AI-2E family transporter [Marinobacter]NWN92382.1 AI-2E family transporter [Marinobacter adhaerens]
MKHEDYPNDKPGPGIRRTLASLSTPVYGLFVLGVLYTLYLAHQIILPIVLALLTSLLLSPLVTRMGSGLHIPRVVSSLILVLLVLIGVAGVSLAVATPALEWAGKAPEGISRLLVGESELKRQITRVTESAQKVEDSVSELSDGGDKALTAEPTTVVLQTESWRAQLMTKARDGVAGFALAMALTYFLLVSGDRLVINFVRQLPREHRGTVLRITRDSQHQIAQYLGVLGISNLVVGLTTGLMTWALGLPDPAVWGLVAGLARFIPYLGVILTILLLAVVSAVSLDTLWMMAIAPAGYLALTTMVGFFIEPWIHGFRMAINPVIIFVSIFFWGWLWGPVGVLLAVPLMTVIQVVLKQIPRLRPIYKVIAR